jgi:UDP-N-acetylmuramoyl-tripeptide--D-alanyl-D-alanine ligase
MSVLLITFAAFGCAALASRGYRALHMLQLDGYRVARYFSHSRARVRLRSSLAGVSFWLALGLGCIAYGVGASDVAVLVGAVGAIVAALITWKVWARPVKKPFALTARMGRLLGVTAALTVGLCAGVAEVAHHELSGRLSHSGLLLALCAIGGALVTAEPIVAVASVILLEPAERLSRRKYIARARHRLEAVSPLVIGIAGSYGKTTTKCAVAAALSGKFKVLASPESYNTLLGVTRTINEHLNDDIDVFVVEMGARQPGDINEICALVRPTVGIITRLGPQHLEYFRTEEAIVRTKTELLRALPSDGLAVVDADGLTDFSRNDEWSVRTLRLSTQPEVSPDVLVGQFDLDASGTAFTVARKGGDVVLGHTRLLGRYAAINCGLAVAVSLELGVEVGAIQEGLELMTPVPHRLDIVRNDSVVVIDDAYSSNPAGFEAALEVLDSFAGRHILVTPGMVELGAASVPAHEAVAEIAARVCDVIVLVGQTLPEEFARTLRDAGFPVDALKLVESLTHATDFLASLIRPGDVVLFENDLPDNYR